MACFPVMLMPPASACPCCQCRAGLCQGPPAAHSPLSVLPLAVANPKWPASASVSCRPPFAPTRGSIVSVVPASVRGASVAPVEASVVSFMTASTGVLLAVASVCQCRIRLRQYSAACLCHISLDQRKSASGPPRPIVPVSSPTPPAPASAAHSLATIRPCQLASASGRRCALLNMTD